MPSPFPGMDPFLEAHWGDVHTSVTTYARNQLQPLLPPALYAVVQEYVHLAVDPDRGSDLNDWSDDQNWQPDVQITESDTAAALPHVVSTTGNLAVAQPLLIPYIRDWTERWIQIVDREQERIITSIEFLSPGNKLSARQRDAFQKKQWQLLQAGVNLVEIDLIRRGGWTMSYSPDLVPDTHCYPYRIGVIRSSHRNDAECYSAPLAKPLPVIRIPLRKTDADIALALQPLIDAAWLDGAYSRRLDYQQARRPRFRTEDEAWIQERIAAWKAAQGAAP